MDRRRKILIFAYFFPPLGGAGVQRLAKFAKHLPAEGWDPTVVTIRSRAYWMADPTLVDDIDPRTRVVRTASLTGLDLLRRVAPRQAGRSGSAPRSGGMLRRLRAASAWVLLPDSYIGWVPFAVRAGRRLLRSERFDALLTSSSPDSAHLIGLSLSREFRVPWVADFRDPWTRRLSFAPPSAWHRRRHLELERRVLEAAALVTVTTEETRADYLRRAPGLSPEKIHVVTNGYDEEDFQPWLGVSAVSDRLRILHAGQLGPERPARPFLEGLRRFLAQRPDARERVRATFIGPHYQRDGDDVRGMGLADVVQLEHARPHGAIIAELLRSHLLLLMEQDSPEGGLLLPGKIFEYLRARRPILGLLPPGAAWRLIEQLDVGRCCRTGDSDACARILNARFESFLRGEPARTALSDRALEVYERRELARRLSQHLRSLV